MAVVQTRYLLQLFVFCSVAKVMVVMVMIASPICLNWLWSEHCAEHFPTLILMGQVVLPSLVTDEKTEAWVVQPSVWSHIARFHLGCLIADPSLIQTPAVHP